MTVITRDAWSDAHRAETEKVLEGDLAAVRRRIWVRHALWIVLGCAALLAAFALTDPNADDLWSARPRNLSVTYGLLGLAVLLMAVGFVRTIGASQPFVAPVDFLSSTERAWLRAQVAEGRAVPDERRAVVAGAARRMVTEGRHVPFYLGIVVLWVGSVFGGATLGTLIVFSVLIVWMLVRVVRAVVWARRARRWLALDA